MGPSDPRDSCDSRTRHWSMFWSMLEKSPKGANVRQKLDISWSIQISRVLLAKRDFPRADTHRLKSVKLNCQWTTFQKEKKALEDDDVWTVWTFTSGWGTLEVSCCSILSYSISDFVAPHHFNDHWSNISAPLPQHTATRMKKPQRSSSRRFALAGTGSALTFSTTLKRREVELRERKST